MTPEVATVAALAIAVGPCGCGTIWFSIAAGLLQPKFGGPVDGASVSPWTSHANGKGSTELEPLPFGNVTVWTSILVLVTHFTLSPGRVSTRLGSISSTSTPLLAVPAVIVMVCVPSPLLVTDFWS